MREFWFEIASFALALMWTVGSLYHGSVGKGMRRSKVLRMWWYMAVKLISSLWRELKRVKCCYVSFVVAPWLLGWEVVLRHLVIYLQVEPVPMRRRASCKNMSSWRLIASRKSSMFKAAPALVWNASDMIFSARAWMRLIKANMRSSFPLNPCLPLDIYHTETQYKNWGRTVEMYVRLRSLVLTHYVDPAIADNIESFGVIFASR